MKKNKAKKTYEVNTNTKWLKGYKIKAASAVEAKRAVREEFESNPGKSLFKILVKKR